jgi:excisionase family DNA binding protein
VTDTSSPNNRFIDPEVVAERLGTSRDEVLSLIDRGEIRGIEVGTPPRLRVDSASVAAYLDDRAEVTRRSALWRQSQEASFPELWGEGDVRHPD